MDDIAPNDIVLIIRNALGTGETVKNILEGTGRVYVSINERMDAGS